MRTEWGALGDSGLMSPLSRQLSTKKSFPKLLFIRRGEVFIHA